MATTTTTVAIGTGGNLALAAAGAAVAGAVGLGLLGVASIFAGGGGDDSKGYGHGHGGQGHGHGHGRKRYGRDVNGRSENLQRMMELIRREDVTGCGLKLMCELGAEDPEGLTIEELAILDIVGPELVPGEDVRGLGALGEYLEAKSIGRSKGSCFEKYILCPLNGTQLMDTVMQFLP